MRARALALAATLSVVATVGCADGNVTPFAPSDPSLNVTTINGITVDFRIVSTDTVVAVGKTMQLGSRATSGTLVAINNSNVAWSSLDAKVATVSSKGLVTGVAAGKTKIVASYAWRGRTNFDTLRLTVGNGGTAISAPTTGSTTGTTTPTTPTASTPTTPTTPTTSTPTAPTTSTPTTPATPTTSAPTPADPTGLTTQAGGTLAGVSLPRVFLDTRMPTQTGRTLTVVAGGNLQKAIDSARFGDVISLQAGATFTGNFVLRAKQGTGWIVIRTSAPDAAFANPGVRVRPTAAAQLAKIVAPNVGAAIATEPGAHHYRLVGLEVTASASATQHNGLVTFGGTGTAQDAAAEVPEWLVLDRSYVHGRSNLHLKRCLTLNSASSAVIDSHLSECHGDGQDTQAILGYNGPGPFKIVNNHLSDAAEIIMFGGADPSLRGTVPADIEIRRNHISNSPDMTNWTVKNLVEFKAAERVLVEANVIENVWPDAQKGFAFVIKSVNQDGTCTTCRVAHIVLRANYVADAAGGVAISAIDNAGFKPGEYTHHVLVTNNVFERIGARKDEGGYFYMPLGAAAPLNHIVFDQNTASAAHWIIAPDGLPSTNTVITNNLFSASTYGIKGPGTAAGTGTLTRFFTGLTFTSNAFAGGDAKLFPTGTLFPTSLTASLRGTDGRAVGADAALISTVTAGVR